MNRRRFIQAAGVFSTGLAFSASRDIDPAKWRTFEIRTEIEILQPAGVTRIWVPTALPRDTPFQRTISNSYHCAAGAAKVVRSTAGASEFLAAEFSAGTKPALTLTSRVRTRDWAVDLSAPHNVPQANRDRLRTFLEATTLIPTGGIVAQRAAEITRDAKTDLAKARAIYEWIVENTYRNPETRGCGRGDIRFMLESGDLGGKCADLNALFVGLARAAGLPARDVYGIRIAPSLTACRSLGAASTDVTKAQHCRAEVFLSGYGWVPVDPADVRKVVLEEPPGHRPLDDPLVRQVRRRLFGAWEMNWMAYNYAQDVTLPGSSGPPVHFLMYPQAETAEGRLDPLDPQHFRYKITSSEIATT